MVPFRDGAGHNRSDVTHPWGTAVTPNPGDLHPRYSTPASV